MTLIRKRSNRKFMHPDGCTAIKKGGGFMNGRATALMAPIKDLTHNLIPFVCIWTMDRPGVVPSLDWILWALSLISATWLEVTKEEHM